MDSLKGENFYEFDGDRALYEVSWQEFSMLEGLYV